MSGECDNTLEILRKYGNHPSGFLALNSGNQHFTIAGVEGFIAYRTIGRTEVQFGGPVAQERHKRTILAAFLRQAHKNKHNVLALQLLEEDVLIQQEFGFKANQLGTSYGIRLSDFTLRGQKYVKTRNMISRASRDGSTVEEWAGGDTDEVSSQLDSIDREWLRNKGRLTRNLSFLIGERTGNLNHHRRIFISRRGGRIEGYVTFAPAYCDKPGWLYDLTRRRPDSPRGVVEQIFSHAAGLMRDEGAEWLHLGMTPFVDLRPSYEFPTAHKSAGRTIKLLADYGQAIYPSDSQKQFKTKWRPTVQDPEYLAYTKKLSARDIWQLMRVVNII